MGFLSDLNNSVKFSSDSGYSARKVFAYVLLFLVIVIHGCWIQDCFRKNDWGLLIPVLTIDFGFIASCLGMTTYENIQSKKIDSQNKAVSLPPNNLT